MKLVVLGSSWGGIDALGRVLGALPGDFAAAVAIAQHRRASYSGSGLCGLLAARSRLPVAEVEDKDPVRPGIVHVAPADYHLLVDEETFALSTDAPQHHSRPSIDVLFESAAEAYGAGVIGVILTGANADGAVGLARIRERGGVTIVQDPETAVRAEMPRAALAAGAPDAVLDLDGIAARLQALAAPRVSP